MTVNMVFDLNVLLYVMAYPTEIWSQSIHWFGETQVVALDFSKAFDRVWHENLLGKISAFGVRPFLKPLDREFLIKSIDPSGIGRRYVRKI